ncbi:MAG: nitrous oxide reductase accessory protein NosL [Melioribacteraceae bacterium]|nr:nitrous oxide reductase accessory protein NosL [Melioribacteraceae bacterium]
MKSILSLIIISFLFASCSVEESPIVYGKDACHFCRMNIVDNQHAAQIVTQKGKPFKFDAIECMMRVITEKEENSIALFLITDYSTPGKLVDATKATYLISENLPSPMGANLTGFKSKSEAEKVQKEKGGTLYSWSELKLTLKK